MLAREFIALVLLGNLLPKAWTPMTPHYSSRQPGDLVAGLLLEKPFVHKEYQAGKSSDITLAYKYNGFVTHQQENVRTELSRSMAYFFILFRRMKASGSVSSD
ncbi:hypothetical protein NPIL_465391 [Nephila pilipes]|uniref:Uncharacterized protein n=1 Tax=Nephila pilipes TaxID=299642 RepID=A0A8X6NTL1_NEPPI|nr:hypothetical protein NPIL_465391 [Nephila pilipes]